MLHRRFFELWDMVEERSVESACEDSIFVGCESIGTGGDEGAYHA